MARSDSETLDRTMRDRLWARLTAAAGIAFVVLMAAAVILMGEEPAPDTSIAGVQAYFVENRSSVLAASYLDGVGALILVGFAAGLAGLAQRSSSDPWSVIGRLIVGGAVATAAVAVVLDMARAALAFRAADAEPATVQVLYDLYLMPLVLLPFATFQAAVGAGILRSTVLPRWLGWSALVLAALSLTGAAGNGDPRGPVAMLGFIGGFALFGLWTLVVCGMLLARRELAEPAPQPRPAI
jgi:hypothetical protein